MRSIALIFAALAVSHLCAAEDNVVETTYGKIRGVSEVHNGVKLTAFYGVPFAAPPVKDLRFKPPQEAERWSGIKDCLHEKELESCPQFHTAGNLVLGKEDCLYLNIYVPEDAAKQGALSTMFWIYGGGFLIGDSSEFGWYKGKNLAASRGVIVVAINYRLGALSFLTHPALLAESGTTGNLGLQDQTFALQFIHDNIKNFGGDPSRIAIFGESAGAFSVCWHLVSPASAGLFSAAIMESGTCESAEFFVSLNRSYEFSQEVINYVGCNKPTSNSTLECLRDIKFEDFMNCREWPSNTTVPPLAPFMPWGSAIDGSPNGLLARPIELLKAGQFNRVPTILGTNKDEGTIFVPALPTVVHIKLPLTPQDLPLALSHFFNETTVDILLNLYNESDFKSTDALVATLLRDYFFLCPNRQTARAISASGVPTYLYHFNFPLTNWIEYDLVGNCHTSEIDFVFDNEWPPIINDFTPEEKRLSASFTLYWTNMAKYGNPNVGLGPDQAVWPRYNTTTDMNLFMLVPTVPNTGLNKPVCDVFDTIYPKYYFD